MTAVPTNRANERDDKIEGDVAERELFLGESRAGCCLDRTYVRTIWESRRLRFYLLLFPVSFPPKELLTLGLVVSSCNVIDAFC